MINMNVYNRFIETKPFISDYIIPDITFNHGYNSANLYKKID